MLLLADMRNGGGWSRWRCWRGLLFTPSFLAYYKGLAPPQFTDEQARIDTFACPDGWHARDQAQDDPWCNDDPAATAYRVPSGSSSDSGRRSCISLLFQQHQPPRAEIPLRHGGRLFEPGHPDAARSILQFASTTAIGDLYRNAGIVMHRLRDR